MSPRHFHYFTGRVPFAATALLVGVATMLAMALPGAAAPATQPVPPNTAPGVCDQYAGDPDPGTPAWTARDLNNVDCSYQRRVDAQTNPAFAAKNAQQTAVELFSGPHHQSRKNATQIRSLHRTVSTRFVVDGVAARLRLRELPFCGAGPIW